MRFLMILLIISGALKSMAQDRAGAFNSIFEEIVIDNGNAENLEELYQQLYYRYMHPLDLNKVNYEDLRELVFLDHSQIEEIIEHRKVTGAYQSHYELQALTTMTIDQIKILSRFVAVDERTRIKESRDYVLLTYDRDLQQRIGYQISEESGVSPYLGSPDKLQLRMRKSLGKRFNFGMLMEKDAGENMILDPATRRYGFDHYSAYVTYQGSKTIEKIVVGDYQLQFGQGLVYSSGFTLGKSAGELAQFRRISAGIRPHTSSLENGFLRGGAIKLRHRKWSTTLFLSSNKHNTSLDEERNSFASFNQSGFHRTRSEVAQRDNLKENHVGAYVEYENSGFNGGIGYSAIQFDAFWEPADRLYNINAFRGDKLNTIFTNMSYRWKNFNFFHENAWLLNGGSGHIGGALFNLTRSFQAGLIYRNYAPDFASIYGAAIGEKSRNSNEEGTLMLVSYRFPRKAELSFYFDRFSFPWLSFRLSSPSRGYEYLTRMKYYLNRKSYFLFQYREELKGRDFMALSLPQIQLRMKRNYQVLVHFPVDDRITLRSRIQGSATDQDEGFGYVFSQDFFYTTLKYKITARYAVFNVSGFDNRQYLFENDVLYSFSFPFFQNSGQRFYLMVKYNLLQNVKLWVRFAQTIYSDVDEISSGNELISGNRLSEVKFQVMYQL